MTEQKHRTVLEIAVDDRAVKGLATSIERAFDADQVKSFTDVVERSAHAMSTLEAAIGGLGKLRTGGGAAKAPMSEAEKAAKEKAQADKKAAADRKRADDRERREEEQHREQQARERREVIGRVWDRAMGMVGAAAAGSFTGALAGALPLIGGAATGVLSGVQGFYQEFAQAQGALTRGFGASGVDSVNPETFTPYGMGPTEAAGFTAQASQRSGRTGEDLRELLGTQARLQSLAGVQGAAGIVGAEESRGGRAADAQRLMMDAVSTGLEAGIRTAKLDQYLSNISSWVEQTRTQGIDFSTDSALALARGFAGLGTGFAGEAGIKRAQGVGDALSRAADQNSIGTGLAFEAARKVLGGDASVEDLIDLQEKKDARFIQAFLEMARSVMGGDVLGMRGLLKNAGIDMSIEQLRNLQRGDLSGFTGTAGGSAEAMLAQRQEGFDRVAGTSRVHAAHEFAKAGLGGEAGVQSAAQSIMHNDLELARAVLPHVAPILEKLSSFIPLLMHGGVKEASRGMLNEAGEKLGVQGLGDDWVAGIQNGVGAALREFFTLDTLRILGGSIGKTILHDMNPFSGDALQNQLNEAGRRKEEAERNKNPIPPEDGPSSALQRGAAPAIRAAALQLNHAAAELERMHGMSDGGLGYG